MRLEPWWRWLSGKCVSVYTSCGHGQGAVAHVVKHKHPLGADELPISKRD